MINEVMSYMILGWEDKYKEILKEFRFDERRDVISSRILDNEIERTYPIRRVKEMIYGKTVFVIGAGPSLTSAISTLKKFNNVPKIVADGGVLSLFLNNKISANIIVTDLDSNNRALQKIADDDSVVFVVHAHGDNIDRLHLVRKFKNCIGTTQTNKVGKIHNFGGFTDGDRAVFLAEYFGAKKIILFGMDFGKKIGKYSFTEKRDRNIKLQKLNKAKELLEWLALKSKSEIYTTSKPIKGIKTIKYSDLLVMEWD